jgi:AcrR family transcriptional regulator
MRRVASRSLGANGSPRRKQPAGRASALPPRRGGRPSREEAARLESLILDAATEMFLTQGYGAVSIEALAGRLRISKRTFYARFRDKADLFKAVVSRLIERWRGSFEAHLAASTSFEESLRNAAEQILAVSMTPEALALYRIILAEARRFPELARVMSEVGAEAGITRIGQLLQREAESGRLRLDDVRFAAEQFMVMVVAGPRRRALGLGTPLNETELKSWARRTVRLFLEGLRGGG